MKQQAQQPFKISHPDMAPKWGGFEIQERLQQTLEAFGFDLNMCGIIDHYGGQYKVMLHGNTLAECLDKVANFRNQNLDIQSNNANQFKVNIKLGVLEFTEFRNGCVEMILNTNQFA